jgi:hypothetical protein
MASSATTILGLRKQGTGDNEDTWGTELNEDALDLIDEAHGVESIALTGDKTLTSTDYVTNEARKAVLRLTDGGLSAAPTITIPAVRKTYIVHNTTTYVVTVSCGGTDATVAAQRWALVYCDATNVYAEKLFQSEDQASYGGAYEYAFSTTTADADPGAGVLRLDNATASSATGIYVSDSEAGGADISALLLTWDDSTSTVKGFVKLQSKATPATFHIYSLSALTDNSGYVDYTVTHVAGSGAFTNAEEVLLTFSRTGDKGETGATGATGAVTAAGDGTVSAPGIAWAADTNTGFYRTATGTTAYAADGVNVATLSSTGLALATDLAVSEGGSGRSSHTAYALIAGGTTATAPQQSIASVGTAGQVLTSAGAGALPTFEDLNSGFTSGTAVTASGTSIDFTGIPSGINVIIIEFSGVSAGGGGSIEIQLGDSGGIETTSYISTVVDVDASPVVSTSTTSFVIKETGSSLSTGKGHVILTNINGNIWAASSTVSPFTASVSIQSGSKTLSGTLTSVRVLGSSSFSGGTINIKYQ